MRVVKNAEVLCNETFCVWWHS